MCNTSVVNAVHLPALLLILIGHNLSISHQHHLNTLWNNGKRTWGHTKYWWKIRRPLCWNWLWPVEDVIEETLKELPKTEWRTGHSISIISNTICNPNGAMGLKLWMTAGQDCISLGCRLSIGGTYDWPIHTLIITMIIMIHWLYFTKTLWCGNHGSSLDFLNLDFGGVSVVVF